VDFNDATLFVVVQFMAEEAERQRLGGPGDWSPYFVIENDDTSIEIKPMPRGELFPDYEFDPIKNPRLFLRIKESITLRRLLDAVCEKTGFEWEVKDNHVRIFKQQKNDQTH
jgi:hypothetical protein